MPFSIRHSVTLLLVALTLSACGNSSSGAVSPVLDAQNAQPTEQPEVVAVTIQFSGDVVATVNGEPIYTDDVQRMLQRRQQELNAADSLAVAESVVNTMINRKLMAQEAARLGITVTDAEIDREISNLRGFTDGSDEAWQQWLDQNLFTIEEFRKQLAADLLTNKLRDNVVGDIPANTTQVHARHILVETDVIAREVVTRLNAGESFVDLALIYSQDATTFDQGGDLGWFTLEELLEPVVAQVAFAQEPGAVSAPTPTRLGYHIIQTLEFDTLPLEPEKRAQIAQAIFEEWLITLYDSAIIERF